MRHYRRRVSEDVLEETLNRLEDDGWDEIEYESVEAEDVYQDTSFIVTAQRYVCDCTTCRRREET